MSVCPSLKILVTTALIGFYFSGNIPTGPVVVLGYFLGGWDTPNPQKTKNPPLFLNLKLVVAVPEVLNFFNLPLGAKQVECDYFIKLKISKTIELIELSF